MSIPHRGDVAQLVELLLTLREHGVTEFQSGDLRVVLAPELPPSISVAPFVSTQPSTPEHSGNTDTLADEKPKMDIFDILDSGVIPGAPRADGLPVDPSTS